MARSLFWLSDEAWNTLEPHLPHGKPGKPRVDDRTVISGILHVLKTGCRWRDVPPAYGPPTTIYNRYNRWSQRRIWQRIFEMVPFLTSFPSTAAMSRRTARRLVQKGGARGSDWPFARPKNEQNPCFGRWSRQTGRLCADPGKRRRHHHGRSIAWSRRQAKAAAGRQSLRRRQPAQMAQTKEGQSRRSIHSLTPDALSSGQQDLQTQKSHRAHVLQAQELATHRNPI
jgi:transposase